MDEIFKADKPVALTVWGYGSCNRDCQPCALNVWPSDCPPDDNGYPQYCIPLCP